MSARSPPPPRRSVDERRRWVPWLVSAGVHGLLLAWWASLPSPSREDEPAVPELRPVELVELPPSLRAVEPVVPPNEAAIPEPETKPETEPEPNPVERARPARRASSPQSQADPTSPSPSTDDDDPAPAPGGIALLGLRGRSQPPSSGRRLGPVLRPQLPPPAGGGPIGGGPVVRKVGAEGPATSPQRDGPPRSLAEAGFRKRRSGKMVYRDAQSGFVATLLPDGRLKFRETVTPSSMPGLAEALRSASGQELYIQQKKRLLEQTFELRLQMAVSFASDKIDRRLASLYRELLEQWSRTSKSEAERRVALFERWDECEEGLAVRLRGFEGVNSSELDQKRRAAGQQARQTIERFIRRQLPSGSPQAYTAEELRRLNARRHSRARFAPYD
ncbi:MAG: hypothetical protein AAGF11_52130 [Myxococcota bacterium]